LQILQKIKTIKTTFLEAPKPQKMVKQIGRKNVFVLLQKEYPLADHGVLIFAAQAPTSKATACLHSSKPSSLSAHQANQNQHFSW